MIDLVSAAVLGGNLHPGKALPGWWQGSGSIAAVRGLWPGVRPELTWITSPPVAVEW